MGKVYDWFEERLEVQAILMIFQVNMFLLMLIYSIALVELY